MWEFLPKLWTVSQSTSILWGPNDPNNPNFHPISTQICWYMHGVFFEGNVRNGRGPRNEGERLFITYSFVLFGVFFLSAHITNPHNYYIVAIVKKTRKNQQIGLNMDLLYWGNVTVKWSCSMLRLTESKLNSDCREEQEILWWKRKFCDDKMPNVKLFRKHKGCVLLSSEYSFIFILFDFSQ